MALLGRPNVEKMARRRDVKGLVKALGSDLSRVAGDAANALGKLRDPASVEPLLVALAKPETRRWAMIALGRIGDQRAFDPMLELLGDGNAAVRGAAAWALGNIGDTRATEPLVNALHDVDESVRLNALHSLAKLEDTRAVGPIMGGVRVRKDEVVHALVALIPALTSNHEVPRLAKLLRYDDPVVRRNAATALGHLADPQCVDSLARALRPGKSNSFDAACFESAVVAEALVKIGAPAVDPLIAMLTAGDPAARYAAYALGEIGDERAVEPLAAALNDAELFVRRFAAEALTKIGSHSARKALEDHHDEDSDPA